jgi:predicted nucleotidyltransferase
MKIADNTIVGLPIRVVRDLMRHFSRYIISEETAQEFFDTLRWRETVDAAVKVDNRIPRSLRSQSVNISRKEYARIWDFRFNLTPKREAKAIFASLLADGWIEPNLDPDEVFDDGQYVVSDKGRQLSVKNLVPRINREKADKIVGDMIKRIQEINCDPSLLDYVTKVVAFGSYITDAEDLGDIDLYVVVTRRIDDYKEHTKARKTFNESSGKRFSNYLEQLFYHQYVVKQRIKSRSPYISLHDESDLELAGSVRTLYEFQPPIGDADTSASDSASNSPACK